MTQPSLLLSIYSLQSMWFQKNTLLFKGKIYIYIERESPEEEREGGRERETLIGCLPHVPQLETKPTT